MKPDFTGGAVPNLCSEGGRLTGWFRKRGQTCLPTLKVYYCNGTQLVENTIFHATQLRNVTDNRSSNLVCLINPCERVLLSKRLSLFYANSFLLGCKREIPTQYIDHHYLHSWSQAIYTSLSGNLFLCKVN